ncbi:MAG: sugar phosphate nucleotidyltransferase [bacterium]|nr:sugar phosphate nucleotidyltransferase [bacterium]
MKAKSSHLYGVILAGGSGTRLWPLSTKKCPKQFLAIGSKESLMGQTVSRLAPLLSEEDIWVVCGEAHAKMISEEFPKLNTGQILWEPQAKNTAPALALASIHLLARDPEAVMVILPADHLIIPKDWGKFAEDVRLAAQVARTQHALVTFGIQPDQPSTGFGYIERGKEHTSGGKSYFEVKAFHEKPDLPKAREYLIEGTY